MKKTIRSAAFSLVELMIVIAILSDVMVVAVPAYLRARQMAQNTKFVGDLKTCSEAFEMYAAENNKYPNSTGPGVVPQGMTIYLRGFPWEAQNSLQGEWLWRTDYLNTTASIVIQFSTPMDDLRMTDIDSRFDNGILATGAFREDDPTHFYYIIEQ